MEGVAVVVVAASVAATPVETEVKFAVGDEVLHQVHSPQVNVQKKRPPTPTTLPQKTCCLTTRIPIAPPLRITDHHNQLT